MKLKLWIGAGIKEMLDGIEDPVRPYHSISPKQNSE